MKVGVCVHFSNVESLDEKFKLVREQGFDNFQLISWNPKTWTEENADQVHSLVEKHDLEISAFWCGWSGPVVWDFYDGQQTLGLVPLEYRQQRIFDLCNGADFAKLLGVKNVVTHMGFIPENPYDPNFNPLCIAIRLVAEYLERNGQNLLFETGQETPVTLLRCMEQVGKDNLGVNLDTGNLILYGKANPVDALDILGPYVKNVHAKDGLYPVNGHDLGEETPIGSGKVDFHAFIQRLHSLDYDSYLTIEREIEGEQQAKDIVHAKEYLEAIIREIGE